MAETTQNALPGNDPNSINETSKTVQPVTSAQPQAPAVPPPVMRPQTPLSQSQAPVTQPQTPAAPQQTPPAPQQAPTAQPQASTAQPQAPIAQPQAPTASVAVVPVPAENPPKTGKKSHRHKGKRVRASEEPLADERAPARRLSTKRGLIRFLFFTVITCGIYTLFFVAGVSEDMNVLAGRHDGKRTPNLLLLPFITALTCGLGYFIYWHKFTARIHAELWRRGVDYDFRPGKFWGWGVFGILLFGLGPLIFFHKLCVALNKLSADYNLHG